MYPAPAEAVCQGLRRGSICSVVDDDGSAVAVQRPNCRSAYPSRGAGDQYRLALQRSWHIQLVSHHETACAPVISTAAPQMKGASSEARKATSAATSSGRPIRPNGI